MVDRAVGWVEALGKTITVSDSRDSPAAGSASRLFTHAPVGRRLFVRRTRRSTYSPTSESTTRIDDEMITEALDKAGPVDYRAQSAAG
jgi:hypothetical protein